MAMRLKELWDRYRFDDVNFQDETFFTKAQRVEALAEQIVESGMKITWAATMRADQGVRLPADVWARCKQSGLRRLLVGVESGSNEMLKRIHKDIKIEQVFAHRGEDAATTASPDIFPFIVGFPDESDESIQASLDCAKKLRSMSPEFLTPIYYFKPYPGSALVIEAVARGFRLPETLEAWAQFDYVAGEPGSVGFGREVRAHRAVQVLPRAGVEDGCRAASGCCSDLRAIAATGTTTAGRSRCCSPAGWCRRRSYHDACTRAAASPACRWLRALLRSSAWRSAIGSRRQATVTMISRWSAFTACRYW